ncbi:hypothetical protein Bca101_047081 [Brassica carinata]
MDLAAPPDSPVSPTRDKGESEVRDEGSTVGATISLAEAKKAVPSWLSVAQDKKVLKKFEVEVSHEREVHSVEIPDDVLTTTTPLWEDFVVGRFLDISPHVVKVHMVLNKIWKYGDASTKMDVYEVNATTMTFRVSNLKAREKILKRGMWNITGVPMIVTKWTPRSEEEKQEEEAVPMWVHLRGVPLHMYSWEGPNFITSAVGFPVKLHLETIACTNLDVAKVFAKVDVSKVLPKEINFKRNGKEFVVDFHFPWLPSRCKLCDKWWHTEDVCGLRRKESEKVDRRTEINTQHHETNRVEGVGSGKETTQQQEVDNEVERAQVETNTVGTKGAAIEDGVLQQAVEKADTSDEVGVDEANNWSLVSPEKVGRSPVATPRGNQLEDFHISVSKFAVLSVDGQEEEQEEDGEIKGPGFQLSDAAFPALETSTKVDKERSVDNQSVVEAA